MKSNIFQLWMDQKDFKKEVKKFIDWLPKDILKEINQKLKLGKFKN